MERFGFSYTEAKNLRVWEMNALVDHLNKEAKRRASEEGTVRR